MEEFISQLLSSAKGAWKYRWWALGVMRLVALAGWARILALPDDYQSSARVFVDTQNILKPLLANMTSVPNVEQQVAIMSRTLLSRPNIERVMRMADLDRRAPDARAHERAVEDLSSVMQQLKVALVDAEARTAAIAVRVQEYAARHRRLLALSHAAPEVETQLAQLNRDYLINKDNYEKLVARREAATLSGEVSASTDMMAFKIIDPPSLPATPAGPKRLQLNSAVLLASLAAGAATAWALSQVRPTFDGPALLREVTGLNVLGSVQMHWTPADTLSHRRHRYWFGAGVDALFCVYASVAATGLLKH